jgi:hypothetical protein
MTDFNTICKILGEMHISYTEDGLHSDFVQFNDLGVPLAYFVSEGLATPSEEGRDKILETWELLMRAAEKEDTGFSELDDVLD